MHALTGKRTRWLAKLRDEHQNLFATVLEEGVSRIHDHVTVLGVLGMFNWTHVWFDAHRGPLSSEQVADRLTDIVVDGERLAPRGTKRSARKAAAAS